MKLIIKTPKMQVDGSKIVRPDGQEDWNVAFESFECPELAALLKARMLKPFMGKDYTYDLDVWCFEPDYCENLRKLQEIEAQNDYNAAGDYRNYCETFEPTYDPEDGRM